MIIFRYLSKEVLHTLTAISAILLLVFLSNLFVRYLSYAANSGIPLSVVMKLVLIQVPYLLGLLLPLGFFIALLLAYGRLYADSEMTVLFACGMGKAQLVRMSVCMAGILSVIVALMTFWMIPHLLTYRNNLMAQATEDAGAQILFPGNFQQLNNGKEVIYVESLDNTHQHALNVFLALHQSSDTSSTGLMSTNGAEWTIASAQRAYRQTDPKNHTQYAILKDGYRYVGTPGHRNYSITKFDTFAYRLNQRTAAPSQKEENLPTSKLWYQYHERRRYAAEIQWRLAMPIATLVLAFLGVAMSKIDPRKGKYTQLLPATGIAIVYANLLFVARNTIRSGSMPPFWGIAWVHLVFLAIAILLLWQRDRAYRYIQRGLDRLSRLCLKDKQP